MKKFVLVGIVIGAIILVALVAGRLSFDVSSNTPDTSSTGLKVIASFYPLYEFSKEIGGDKAEVTSLIPVGVEPHEWEPTSKDTQRIAQADLFIFNGAGFEPFVAKLISSAEYRNVVFVETAKDISLIEADKAGYDPHIWLDPVLAKHQVQIIKQAMMDADPQNASYYNSNANSYLEKLDELDQKIKTTLSRCNKNTFVSFHNAFTYFAKRYNLHVLALSGISPESEASALEIKNFLNIIKQQNIKVIFSEELVDPKLAQALAEEAGIEVMVLSPIEGLTKEDIELKKTYITKMEDNLQNLKIALECQ